MCRCSARSDARAIATPALIQQMLDSGDGISDLVFSPGRPPQVERFGELTTVPIAELPVLKAEDTAAISQDLIRNNELVLRTLKETGSADLSYALPDRCRFRVNVFRQRGTFAIVMRMIAQKIPSIQELGLPPAIADCATLKNGIVLVTGPTGSGKSSTLAAIIDLINTSRADHILTIEDPIEFLHNHKKGTVHQRELHTDTPTFALALRAALRQAPKVILVGEMRDRETIEIALTAAETGHLVFSTLHTIDASKTVERIVGTFEVSDQQAVRGRLAASFRYFISQRLIPKKGGGRMAIIEMLKATMRTREYIEMGEKEGKSLLDAMRDGALDGMQYFDGELERLVREGAIAASTAYLYATNPGNLQGRPRRCSGRGLPDYCAERPAGYSRPERVHHVDPRRARRRHQRCDHRRGDQHHRGAGERQRAGHFDVAEEPGREPQQHQARDHAGDNAERGNHRALPENARQQVRRCRSDREPHAEFAHPRADGERQHARDPDHRDGQRHQREAAEHQRVQPVRREHFGAHILQRRRRVRPAAPATCRG